MNALTATIDTPNIHICHVSTANASRFGNFDFKFMPVISETPKSGVMVYFKDYSEAFKIGSALVESRQNGPTKPWKDVRNKEGTGPA
jgi:hypothetical protein